MVLMPDTRHGTYGPGVFAQSTMAVFCDVLDPITGRSPTARDPRTTAKKAEAYLQALRPSGDIRLYRGPEPEFFHLRRRQVQGRPLQHRLQARFDRTAVQRRHDLWKPATLGHRSAHKGAAISRCLRSTAARTCARMCSPVLVREWACTVPRSIIPRGGFGPVDEAVAWLFEHPDPRWAEQDPDLQVRRPSSWPQRRMARPRRSCPARLRRQRVGHACRRRSIWKGRGKPTFAVELCGLSENLPVYSRRHHQARKGRSYCLQPPSTNSYKDLVPGLWKRRFCSPTRPRNAAQASLLAFRFGSSPESKRVAKSVFSGMRAGATPYLAFAAMLMAAIDGHQEQ